MFAEWVCGVRRVGLWCSPSRFGVFAEWVCGVRRVGLGCAPSEFLELSGLVCGLFRVGLANPSSRLGFYNYLFGDLCGLLWDVCRVALVRALRKLEECKAAFNLSRLN